MNKYLLAVALSGLAASPALAATAHQRADSANAAYDYALPNTDTVVANGKILGADPDPAIREQLLREPNTANIGD